VIVKIPNATDFARASVNLLNLAWQIAVESLWAYQHSEIIHDAELRRLPTDVECPPRALPR
jgi:hypothetical protein